MLQGNGRSDTNISPRPTKIKGLYSRERMSPCTGKQKLGRGTGEELVSRKQAVNEEVMTGEGFGISLCRCSDLVGFSSLILSGRPDGQFPEKKETHIGKM